MEYGSHPHGTFCFAELDTPNTEGAARFYGELFGWTVVPAPDASALFVFRLHGKDVIAMRRIDGPQSLIGFIAVESADRIAAQAQELGAVIVAPPSDTPGMARTCVLEDPEGARFGLWEPRGHNGAHVQDYTGTMWWAELMARDINDARRFYTSLFGWSFGETRKYGNDLTIFRIGDVSVCSALQYHLSWGVTPHWTVIVAIEDWDATTEKACALGGELGFWRDVPNAGRFGVIVDPGGAIFGIMRPDVIAT